MLLKHCLLAVVLTAVPTVALPMIQSARGAVREVDFKYTRIVQTHACTKPGYYCYQNGVDWATCNMELQLVTNDVLRIVDTTRRCVPGEWVAPL